MENKRTKEQVEREIHDFQGCGKKLDNQGYCWYISSRGNLRVCFKCKKKRDLLFEEFKRIKELK